MPGTHERTADAAAALGRAAASLRSVTFESFGDWSPATDGIEPFTGDATEWLAKRTDDWVAACAGSGHALGASDLAFVRRQVAERLDVVPSYVHHDLKLANCVCVDGEVSGLFDLGEGIIGDPIENLARAVWDLAISNVALAVTFLDSYERAAGVQVAPDRLRAYVILDLLVIWEYGIRQRAPWFRGATFQSWATSFAAPVDRAMETAHRS